MVASSIANKQLQDGGREVIAFKSIRFTEVQNEENEKKWEESSCVRDMQNISKIKISDESKN